MIRKLINDDRALLKQVLIDTQHFNAEEIQVALELIDTYLKDEQSDYIIYVHTNDITDKVEGYICYGKRPLTESTYDLYWIAVDPNTHGKGIGSRLIAFMEEDLKERGAKLVLIETSGKAAYENERKFYEKNRYKLQTVIRDFYRPGDHLVLYHKYL
ncbi:MAG: GNAT family N-acetyltransferase [Ignavibacteriae bacterium]|nr:MAG: GNAT family N-acetyltransferase [Ignavibacteriota bacterium]